MGCARAFFPALAMLLVLGAAVMLLAVYDPNNETLPSDPSKFAPQTRDAGRVFRFPENVFACRGPEETSRFSRESRESGLPARAVVERAMARGDCRSIPLGATYSVIGRNRNFIMVRLESGGDWMVLAKYAP